MIHKFPYKWTLKDANFTKDKGKVFSCFACGGGSTMGYKLAGFDVVGFNEIDKRMAECYIKNHNPKYAYVEPIQTFKLRDDLPPELFELDILDGSPPCSSFSMAGNREKDWGKEKKFKEGQAIQVLDTLFFDFIDLVGRLKPKVVIAENVTGILVGNAKKYVNKIYSEFGKIGYMLQHFTLDASKMGVPQKRKRVFFIALRNDLCKQFQTDIFTYNPVLKLKFDEPGIPYKNIEELNAVGITNIFPSLEFHYNNTKIGESFSISYKNKTNKNGWFGYNKSHPDKVLRTIIAHTSGADEFNYRICRGLSKLEFIYAGTFPSDYDFLKLNPKYLIGMSVPPIMTAQIATKIYEQWLSKIKTNDQPF